ncbi:hypothetical protein A2U01_0095218, partial [Trifolium medium]|nr:hypothetical protein [Trifolium medium]
GGKLTSPSIKRQGGDCWDLPLNWIEMQKTGSRTAPCARRSVLVQVELKLMPPARGATCCYIYALFAFCIR